MGICLDTDASAAHDPNELENDWSYMRQKSSANGRIGTANSVAIDMQNAGKIKFDPPKVPVIFVLGGPGSGKVTHSDTFMQERRGVTHINMMDLLQQYAMGNDMQDYSQLSSRTVIEVIMLEMKMAPAAKVYLISGFPRSMRDVVEYSEKIQVVNGVILISWRKSILQKQIDYGSKLGHVYLSLAKMELENFFKKAMAVADYFDQSDMLLAVNGERAPTEVYVDFRAAVLDILSTLENQEAMLNGVTGMGRGIHDIPGSIVSVDTAPSQAANIADTSNANNVNNNRTVYAANHNGARNVRSGIANAVGAHIATSVTTAAASAQMRDAGVITTQPELTQNRQNAATSMNASDDSIPPVIWVIGGPGSNKAMLCMKAIGLNPGWGHISMGRLLRAITDSAPRANTENYTVKEALSAGEMVPEKAINNILDANIRQMMDRKGILIDGFPRNLQQVKYFENKYKQRPPIVLLDCSKLQLGRGRVDDTVSSFRRRLELFREQTLPMLKTMDNSSRLQIVDGDTDSPSVQREFEKIIRQHIQALDQRDHGSDTLNNRNMTDTSVMTNHVVEHNPQTDAILHDLENNVPGAVPTISHHVSLMNGHLKNRNNSAAHINGNVVNSNHATMNGDAHITTGLTGGIDFRHMLQEAERYPVDSYM
ncbi:adenylate kinase isoenzyme 5 [Ceratitis capitata]|uniref:adenylate kinase isoenzyme 5 n=1 Tax=Ceratitis capitata TaxID=7213 RepID=UPI000A115C61|nr:adenylate kinase isoenzyme 5 [Ceratitis capitata]